ncbi:MAG: potassium-transporting ATPase subunit B, partial [Nitrososphaerota archaeon]|nr:potassium-transporting ATPase subunit B [Nitrososphaerota archaeon]
MKVLIESVLRLNPRSLLSNPVMAIVEMSFILVLLMAIYPQGFLPVANPGERGFYALVAFILLLTVWFSTLSDSIAERQARNTANSLRK